MKKTLAIVLAVLMALAALSSFAFIIGSNETKADFELISIRAVDIDLTQAGLRSYEEIVASDAYWTPGKSLAIAVDFRVWNRTLDGHAGATVNDGPYIIAVTSTTADMSFCQYAVTKVASYVEINNKKELSYVAPAYYNTVTYSGGAAMFGVSIAPRVVYDPATPTAPYNVLNNTIIGSVKAKGYIPTPWSTLAGDMPQWVSGIAVPQLLYGVDPQCVDYTLFLSAKHLAPNAEGVGDLSACFALSWGDDWVDIVKYVPGAHYPNEVGSIAGGDKGEVDLAVADDVAAMLGYPTTHADYADVVKYFDGTDVPLFSEEALQNFYKNNADPGTGTVETAYAAATLLTPEVDQARYTQYLDLSAAGYLVLRMDYTYKLTDATGYARSANNLDRYLIRYDVFKYTPELKMGDIHYIGSYVTENLLLMGDASAVHYEYDGGIVTFDMTGSYIMSTVADTQYITDMFDVAPAGRLVTIPYWPTVAGVKLTYAVKNEAVEINELTKAHADFGTGIGQAQGYPILNGQFTALAAAPKFSTPITNTYKAGDTVAIEAPVSAEETEAPADEVEGDIVDDVDLAPAGDATIAFVCAAAAILACAALAFVMKKAR